MTDAPPSVIEKNMKIGFYVTSAVLVVVAVLLIVSYVGSTCTVESCSTVIDRMSYADAVDRLEELIDEDPENAKLFVKNFFMQLKSTCVASKPS
jgi:hypothetical protein